MSTRSRTAFALSDASTWIAVLASLGAGLLVALMIQLNATLGVHIGVLESSFVVHAIGMGFATLLILGRLPRLKRRIQEPSGILFFGGVLGVFIVLLANVVTPLLGVALTLCLSVAANLLFSTVADHFGWFGLPVIPASRQRVLGLALALIGVALVAFG